MQCIHWEGNPPALPYTLALTQHSNTFCWIPSPNFLTRSLHPPYSRQAKKWACIQEIHQRLSKLQQKHQHFRLFRCRLYHFCVLSDCSSGKSGNNTTSAGIHFLNGLKASFKPNTEPSKPHAISERAIVFSLANMCYMCVYMCIYDQINIHHLRRYLTATTFLPFIFSVWRVLIQLGSK